MSCKIGKMEESEGMPDEIIAEQKQRPNSIDLVKEMSRLEKGKEEGLNKSY